MTEPMSLSLSEKDRRSLVGAEEAVVAGWRVIDEQCLCMDSQGRIVQLVVLRHWNYPGKLRGFLYRFSSEETFFEEEGEETFPVSARQVTKVEYSRPGKSDWSDVF